MSHLFEAHIAEIRDTLLIMSSLTDRSLSHAVRALVERENRLADIVESEDAEIDRLEVVVDEKVVTYMATHSPVARDSRLMVTVTKISGSLERIGDQATTIARRARALNLEPELLTPLAGIPVMARLAQQMLHDAITAFVEEKYELAQEIIPRDKEVDAINRRIAEQLTELMMQSPENVTRGVNLLIVARAIERAADHAKSIAEEVFYLYCGKNIRHEPQTPTFQPAVA